MQVIVKGLSLIFIYLLIVFSLPTDVWSVEGKASQVILKIDGMTCASCPAMVKTALKKLDGIMGADVSFKEAKATVKYIEDKVTVGQMVKAIEGIGMKASLPSDNKK